MRNYASREVLGNLWVEDQGDSLERMSQRSLLFSSDPETARRLAQALRELEFSVDHCREIFAAVERITTHSFELIITDWDDGVEAMFLIKTARELKCNYDAFRIVVAKPEAAAAARQAGAQMVITKPVLPGHTKYALLTSDDFVGRMKNWVPALAVQNSPALAKAVVLPAQDLEPPRKSWMQQQSPVSDEEVGMNLTFDSLEGNNNFFRRLGIQYDAVPAKARPRLRFFMWGAVLAAAILSGYVFSGALKARASSALVPLETRLPPGSEAADPLTPRIPRTASRLTIRVTPARTEPKPEAATNDAPTVQAPVAETVLDPVPASPASLRPSIPASLTIPLEGEIGARTTSTKTAPSLMSDLEPVSLTEDLAEKMLLQRVLPSYPPQALRSKLQGSVLLQAWIRKDGTVRDLKVINGPLLLCQAAYSAVKQWRYKPYVINGQLMEAQTLVTVNFRLP